MSATLRNDSLISHDSLLSVDAGKISSFLGNNEAVLVPDFEQLKPKLASGYSGIEEHSTPFHSFLEHSTLFLFPLVFGLTLFVALGRLYELQSLWWVLVAIPLGIVGGDLVSGLVHWFADTYFSEDTPIIGRSLVKPFRLHHAYPRDICAHNTVVTLGNSCIIAVPALIFCLYLLWLKPESSWPAFKALFVTLLAAATVATNQFHKWAHQENPSALVRWLQHKRLVL